MVCATFDVLRAADNVLVFEPSEGHTASPQPAVALRLWVALEFVRAVVLSRVLVEKPVSAERDAANLVEVLVCCYSTNIRIHCIAASLRLSAAEAN